MMSLNMTVTHKHLNRIVYIMDQFKQNYKIRMYQNKFFKAIFGSSFKKTKKGFALWKSIRDDDKKRQGTLFEKKLNHFLNKPMKNSLHELK